MRLADFIAREREAIMAESLAFAARMPPLRDADATALGNHLPVVLDAIARDLQQPQSRAQSIAKSLGEAAAGLGESAARNHGLQRVRAGLDIEQLIAEYRVLRSCVLRLWADADPPDRHVIDDTMRFNEAIDQAVAESVAIHAAESARWRDLLLGVLGHDLRGPLNAMTMTARAQQQCTSGKAGDMAALLLRSALRLSELLDSLLVYNQSTLGDGMRLRREQVDLGLECQQEVDLMRRAFPARQIAMDVAGDTRGDFDRSRVREALCNLVSNAAQHSPQHSPVHVLVVGGPAAVEVRTENAAPPMPTEVLNSLFEPLKRGHPSRLATDGNLGLGLFIVREIARAHQGEVSASMCERGIRFRMVLPKLAS